MKYTGRYGDYLLEQYDGELSGRCEECGHWFPVYDLRDVFIRDDLTTYKFLEAMCISCIRKSINTEE